MDLYQGFQGPSHIINDFRGLTSCPDAFSNMDKQVSIATASYSLPTPIAVSSAYPECWKLKSGSGVLIPV